MFFKKGTKVKLNKDHKYHQTIFGNSESSTPKVRTLLKKGRTATVSCHYEDGGVEVERNGSYYQVDENDLDMID